MRPNNSSYFSPTTVKGLALSLLFISGFASLCYEICWIRIASLFFGATSLGIGAVLAIFFGGTAVGAFFISRQVVFIRKPIRLLAIFEIITGVLACASPWVFALAQIPFHMIYEAVYENVFYLSTVRLILLAVVILPPSILIGTVFPLFSQFYMECNSFDTKKIALIYALNTTGAVYGCLICGLLLIPEFGIRATLFFVGIISMLFGLIILWAEKRFPPQASRSEKKIVEPNLTMQNAQKPHQNSRLLYCTIFIVGFCALAYEILWTRFLSLLVPNTTYTYTITLATILIGIVLGNLLVNGLLLNKTWQLFALAVFMILGALIVAFTLLLPTSFWSHIYANQPISKTLLSSVILLFIPSAFSGATFPLLFNMLRNNGQDTKQSVGGIMSINTLGGIIGSLLTSFVLLPLLGMHFVLCLITGIGLLGGVAVLLSIKSLRFCYHSWWLSIVCIGIWGLIVFLSPTNLPQDYLEAKECLIDFIEGRHSFISVVKDDSGETSLQIDRMWQGQKTKGYQIMAAHIPMLLHQRPEDVLCVGLGSGQTASRFLYYGISSLDCVDIEAKLPRILKKHFEADWLLDKRVRYISEDGRSYMANTLKAYDVISIEVGQIFRPQVAPFYSREFYQTVKAHLKPDGIVSQFLPVGFFEEKELLSAIKTFLVVFPNSTLWYNRFAEFILIGTNSNTLSFTEKRMQFLRKQNRVNKDLDFSYPQTPKYITNKPEVLVASFLLGADTLTRISAKAVIISDDKPSFEYNVAATNYSPARVKELFISNLDNPHQVMGFQHVDKILSEIKIIQQKNCANAFE